MLALVVVLLPGIAPAEVATLRYAGYVAGVRAGAATVELDITDATYRVTGSAAADGVAEWFSDWRSEFIATGTFQQGVLLPEQYYYQQLEGDTWREVNVRAGVVSYRKNQRPARQRAAFESLDLLTALFVVPACEPVRWVNTGRRNYRLEGRAEHAGRCRLTVFDRHEDSVRVDITLDERFGLQVPIAMVVRGIPRARLVLVEAPALE